MRDKSVRIPAVSGLFYPQNPENIKSLINGLFENTRKITQNSPKALIVPHAGYVYSGQTAAWGYSQINLKKHNHAVIIGPSHSHIFTGLAGSTYNYWQTPLGKINQITPDCKDGQIITNNFFHQDEHAIEVQLPFLQMMGSFSFTALATGNSADIAKAAGFLLKHYQKSIYIFSSDLSHFLPEKDACQKDKLTLDAILKLNESYLLNTNNCACGAIGISMLLIMAKKFGWKPEIINYSTSADISEDKNRVVGYAAVGFY